MISGTGVRMRSGAGTGYDILKTLDKGAVIELTAQEGDWYRISFDGKRGYVAASMSPATTPPPALTAPDVSPRTC